MAPLQRYSTTQALAPPMKHINLKKINVENKANRGLLVASSNMTCGSPRRSQ